MKWTDYLSSDVYTRLGNCTSTKEDIKPLVSAKWLYYQKTGKAEKGFTKEDALVSILELLDCNSRFFDLTKEEYAELIM